jgi:hypothetical protein
VDDPYQYTIDNAKKFIGYPHPEFTPKPNGKWVVYYRLAVEDGEVIFPERFTKEDYEELAENDYWTYITQYMNDPQAAGLAEFYQYHTGQCSVVLDDLEQYWIVKKPDNNFNPFPDESDFVRLADCDCIMTIDPAFTDTGISAKTSRTAIELWARDSNGNNYLIWAKVGYFDTFKAMDFMFYAWARFNGYIRTLFVETNAAQKLLPKLFLKEARERGIHLPITAKPETGDKVARIRSNLGTQLAKNRVWLAKGFSAEFLEEQKVFPQNRYKMDVLDAAEKGVNNLTTPEKTELTNERKIAEEEQFRRIRNAAGY